MSQHEAFLNEEPIMRTFITDDSADIFLQDWGTDGGGKNLAVQLPRFPDELDGFGVSTSCQIDRVTACFHLESLLSRTTRECTAASRSNA